jgi:pyroglutamyl-peptidase
MSTSVLLTGFDPFAGCRVNPSTEVVKQLAAQGFPQLQIHTRILPVDATLAPHLLREALIELRPDWCVMLGQADGRAAISIERVAVNLCDFNIPDNAGSRVIDEPIACDGPAAYFTTLPVRAMLEAMRAAEIPVELSLSAGAYLCNLVFYTALHLCQTQALPTRCGFIHLPPLPAQALGKRPAPATMALDASCAGVRALLQILPYEFTTATAG